MCKLAEKEALQVMRLEMDGRCLQNGGIAMYELRLKRVEGFGGNARSRDPLQCKERWSQSTLPTLQ